MFKGKILFIYILYHQLIHYKEQNCFNINKVIVYSYNNGILLSPGDQIMIFQNNYN